MRPPVKSLPVKSVPIWLQIQENKDVTMKTLKIEFDQETEECCKGELLLQREEEANDEANLIQVIKDEEADELVTYESLARKYQYLLDF